MGHRGLCHPHQCQGLSLSLPHSLLFLSTHLFSLSQKGELVQAGIVNPSLSAIKKALTREELAKHCQRRTCGAEETAAATESLLLALSAATDILGVLLLKEEMRDIWEEQNQHIQC